MSWYILILSSYLRLGLPSGLYPSGLSTHTLYAPLLSLTCRKMTAANRYWVCVTYYEYRVVVLPWLQQLCGDHSQLHSRHIHVNLLTGTEPCALFCGLTFLAEECGLTACCVRVARIWGIMGIAHSVCEVAWLPRPSIRLVACVSLCIVTVHRKCRTGRLPQKSSKFVCSQPFL
jgi:hypothetical protein